MITIVETIRPTDLQVEEMYDANPRGGGVAWRENGKVRWKKGIFKKEMVELNKTLPLPYILHFRIPSHNTSNSFYACHPFAIDAQARYDFEGETDGYVLFHNGFWTGWRQKIESLSIAGAFPIPTGPWSDSRGLAFAAHHLGLGFLEMADEKIVAFGPNTYDIEIFGSWERLKGTDDQGKECEILVSNKSWERASATRSYSVNDTRRHTQETLEAAKQITTGGVKDGESGGTPRPESFRSSSSGTEQVEEAGDVERRNQQQRVQAATEEVGAGDAERGETAVSQAIMTVTVEDDEPVGRDGLISCSRCRKRTSSGQPEGSKFFCWQCWAEERKLHRPFVGECGVCKTGAMGGNRLMADDNWICRTCWEANGKPSVYSSYAEMMNLKRVH